MDTTRAGKIKVPGFTEANGFYTTKAHSSLMSKIKGRNTKPEKALRKAIWGLGIRYRKNYLDCLANLTLSVRNIR